MGDGEMRGRKTCAHRATTPHSSQLLLCTQQPPSKQREADRFREASKLDTFTMRQFGGKAIMSLLVMRMSASATETRAVDDPCVKVVIQVDGAVNSTAAEEDTHSGTFLPVGTEAGFKPVYMSDDRELVLDFVEKGDEYYTYETPLSPLAALALPEPSDESLDTKDLESTEPRTDRRHRRLQTCLGNGYWAVGKKGEGDMATYPMLKVEDCAEDPRDIDPDSEWFRQECHDQDECPPDYDFGTVTVTSEDIVCGSVTFRPTPAPTTTPTTTPTTPGANLDAPVLPLEPTSSPQGNSDGNVNNTTDNVNNTTDSESLDTNDGSLDDVDSADEHEDHDGHDHDEQEDAVEGEDAEGAEDAKPAGEDGSGASRLGGGMGVSFGVAVAVLGAAANVVVNTMLV